MVSGTYPSEVLALESFVAIVSQIQQFSILMLAVE